MKVGMQYWSPLLDDIITEYNDSTDDFERNQLYRNHLDAPIRKVVKCVVAMHLGEYKNTEMVEEETLHHIVLQLEKYNKSFGRSFSYFTTIAKHYVWQYNIKQHQDDRYVSIQGLQYIMAVQVEDHYQEYRDETPEVLHKAQWPETLQVYPPTPEEVISYPLLEYMNSNDMCGGKKERDKKIVNALRSVFKNAEQHRKFNKHFVLSRVRKLTGYTTSQIRNTILRIKRNYETTGA